MNPLLRLLSKYLIIFYIFFINSIFAFSQINTPYLKLISPAGGEEWEANSTQAITWQSSNIARIKILYSLSGGMAWHTVVSSLDASTGQYLWHVPDVQIKEVLIKIVDISNPSLFDVSGKPFRIFKQTSINKLRSVQSEPSIKIMPLGDSITEGDGDDSEQVGYRSELFDLLERAGYNFNFVGTQSSGISYSGNVNFDPDHEGHGGMEVGHPSYLNLPTLLDNIDNYLNSNSPDIVLFHMGTNDLDNGNDPDQIANQLDSVIIYHILVHNPNTFIFWAKLIHNEHVSETILNYDIGTIYSSLTPQQKSRIKLVFMDSSPLLIYPDDFSKSTPDHKFADLHPVESGYNKMAEHWFAAMQAYYLPCLVSPLNNASDQTINVSLSWKPPSAASDFSVVYELQIATDSEFTNIISDTTDINTSSIIPSGLQYGTKYFWRVRIANYGWSDTLNFTTVPIPLYAKVFLQGPYSGGDTMNTNLRCLPGFPKKQPYDCSPWNYKGNESVSSIPSNVVDWILIELRKIPNGPAIVRRAVFLNRDGNIFDTSSSDTDHVTFKGISPGNYYIVIKHRNHLPIMSANTVYLPSDSTYDFTIDSTQAFGKKAMVSLGNGKFGMIVGDNDNDGVISVSDYNDIASFMSKTGYYISDDNMNGTVSRSDYNFVLYNLFKYSQIP